MIAFVMSSGGNRGALQAGALLALFEAGIQPDMLVGTSSGALNGAFLAIKPSLEGARELAEIWRRAKTEDFFPGNLLTMLARLAQGQSLFPSDGLRHFAEHHIPANKRRFGDLPIKLYITSANLNTGRLLLWGDDPAASILDAALASAAYPLAYPPFEFMNFQLVDGAVVANVPIGVAVDKGANDIYILNVGYAGEVVPDQTNIIAILNRSIGLTVYQQFLLDLRFAEKQPDVRLHLITIRGFENAPLFELNLGEQMVEAGHQQTRVFLQNEQNNTFIPPKPRLPPPDLDLPSGGGSGEGDVPDGAHEFTPPWLR